MSKVLFAVSILITFDTYSSLQITNTTPPINITNIFFSSNDAPFIDYLQAYSMTYYIDPSDASKQKYLYYGMFGFINKSSIYSSYVKSDIFTEKFTQYNNNNNITNLLPFTVTNASQQSERHQNMVGFHLTCTAPKTNDILSCWDHSTSNFDLFNYNIICKIYFSDTNTWSNDIIITNNTSNDIDVLNIMGDVICFDDAYFIPYFQTATRTHSVGYGTFIDLKGSIIYNNYNLNITSSPGQFLYAAKGSDTFDVSKLNKDATDSVMLYFTGFYERINRTNISTVYAYYTTITDSHFPLYFYNHIPMNNNTLYVDELNGVDVYSLNWTANCCYISIYAVEINQYYNDFSDIYGVFTDIYGNRIKIKDYDQDILLVHNVSVSDYVYFINGYQIIDLSAISDETVHYFTIMFGNPGASTIVAGVYYLQYNTNDNSYNLANSGYFDTITLPNGDSYNYDFDDVLCYVLPEGYDLYCTWTLYNETENSESLFGQTFKIN